MTMFLCHLEVKVIFWADVIWGLLYLPEVIVSVKSSVDKLDDSEWEELSCEEDDELEDDRERFFLRDIKNTSNLDCLKRNQ